MKYFVLVLCGFYLLPALAQHPQFKVHKLSLPEEIAFYDNQFSGLASSKGKLFLLSESRLQDKAEAKLYTIKVSDLNRKLADSTYVLPYQKITIAQLPTLRARMQAAGQAYEGLEALLVDKNTVYLSVETATRSANCYLLKGRLRPGILVLDTTFLVPLAKPLAPGGSHIYNAGFEALAQARKRLVAFFEFNSFPGQNYAYELASQRLPAASTPRRQLMSKLPFRITDVTTLSKKHFVGLNYFFKGDGEDAVYRPPAADTSNTQLITDQQGFKNYCRLIDLERHKGGFTWRPLWEFPDPYKGYNWEGIAAYKNGYFIINDKYTPTRPYQTTLLYLQRVP